MYRLCTLLAILFFKFFLKSAQEHISVRKKRIFRVFFEMKYHVIYQIEYDLCRNVSYRVFYYRKMCVCVDIMTRISGVDFLGEMIISIYVIKVF